MTIKQADGVLVSRGYSVLVTRACVYAYACRGVSVIACDPRYIAHDRPGSVASCSHAMRPPSSAK